MIQRGYQWRGYWEDHGTRVDDEKIVSIRVGVVDVDGCLCIAISVASAPPVTITDGTAASIGELMEWAQHEHEMLEEQEQQRRRKTGEQVPAGVADISQAMSWLDDIDAQLTDIAAQVRALRDRFPAPADDTSTGTSANDEAEGR